jgi:hypothetical protein
MRVWSTWLFTTALLICSSASAEKAPPLPAPALPENYKQVVQDSIAPTLREPESVKFEFRDSPYQMTCKKGVFDKKSAIDIWMIDVWVNAKNGYGGYTGFQAMSVAVFQQDGSLLQQPFTKAGGGAITRFGLCKRARVVENVG